MATLKKCQNCMHFRYDIHKAAAQYLWKLVLEYCFSFRIMIQAYPFPPGTWQAHSQDRPNFLNFKPSILR